MLIPDALIVLESAADNNRTCSINRSRFINKCNLLMDAADGTIKFHSRAGGYGTYEYSIDGGSPGRHWILFQTLLPEPISLRSGTGRIPDVL